MKTHQAPARRISNLVAAIAVAAFFGTNLNAADAAKSSLQTPPPPSQRDSNHAEPLPYRMISFHRAYPNKARQDQGTVSKAIIRRAAELGYNGVQFMFARQSLTELERFAEFDAKEGNVDFCHRQGMKVYLWIHELSELPGNGEADYLGPVALNNQKLWDFLDRRYERVLGQLLPNIDGLVLTVVETQVRVTEPQMLTRLVLLLRDKCRQYGKELIVRTFVYYPSELEGVAACVRQLPDDVIVMTKSVVQDWQMRGVHDPIIGNVGNHRQIVEYDIAGEFFLLEAVANCMPDVLKEYFDYNRAHKATGVVVRADRFCSGSEVMDQPQEVNLWALGMWASGKTNSVDDVWQAWAEHRYGTHAAPGVIRALKPTSQVVTECINVGPFAFGDSRFFPPPNGDEDAFDLNYSNWKWDSSYRPLYQRALNGDPAIIQQTAGQKAEALRKAQECLTDLELVKRQLDPSDYEILKTRLANNQVQLECRAPIMLAYLRYRRFLNTNDAAEKKRVAAEIRKDLDQIRAIANREYPSAREIDYRGRKWRVGGPDFINGKGIHGLDWNAVRAWTDKMELLLTNI